MKIIRFIFEGQEYYGELAKEKVIFYKGDIQSSLVKTDKSVEVQKVKLLSPVKPSKAVCVGLNYLDHIKESKEKVPEEPIIFMKPSTAVISPGDFICYPPQSRRVDYEGELAIVIGKEAKDVEESKAAEYILGYTCANDVTARDLQPANGQWIIAKGFDTFLPLGPCIDTEADPDNLPIRTILNGKVVQNSNTGYLLFKPYKLVSYISSVMTLNVGDVILTGTTFGIGPMHPGDTVVIEIEGIGRLENMVVLKKNISVA